MLRSIVNIVLTLFITVSQAQELIPFLDGNLYGYSDDEGKIKIPGQFSEVTFFNEDGVANVRKDQNWSLINRDGMVLFPFDSREPIKLSYVFTSDIKLKSPYAHGADTLHHLRLQLLPSDSFRILNLDTWVSSLVYSRSRENLKQSGIYWPVTVTFRNGIYIGRISDAEFQVIDTDLKVVASYDKQCRLWFDSLITCKVSEKIEVYNFRTHQTHSLPFIHLYQVVQGDHYIVSTLPPSDKAFRQWKNDTIKKGMADRYGNLGIDIRYEELIHYYNDLVIARSGNEMFFLDFKGNRIDSINYLSIYPIADRYYKAQLTHGQWVLLDYNANQISPASYDEIDLPGIENYFLFKKGKIAGIMDSNLIHVMSFPADALYKSTVEGFYVIKLNDKHGLINQKGEVIIPAIYDSCYPRENGFVEIKSGEFTGLMKLDGTMLFEPKYEYIEIESDNGHIYFSLKKNGQYALYDQELNQLSDFIHQSSFRPGRSIQWNREEDGLTHFYSRFGKPIGFPVKNYDTDYVLADSTRIALLYKDDFIYVLLPDGLMVTNDTIRLIKDSSQICIEAGLFGVKHAEEEGVINHKGVWIIPPGTFNIIDITEHFIVVKKNGKYYLHDVSGKRTNHRPFSRITMERYQRLSYVERNQKVGYIDGTSGKIVVPLKYDETFRYFEEYATLIKGKKPGHMKSYLIDTLGQIKLKTHYDDLYPLSSQEELKHYQASLNGKEEVINLNGQIIIPLKFRRVLSFADTTFFTGITEDCIFNLLNSDGKIIFSGADFPKSSEYIKLPGGRYLLYMTGYSIILDQTGTLLKTISSIEVSEIKMYDDDVSFLEVIENNSSYLINASTFVEYRNLNE